MFGPFVVTAEAYATETGDRDPHEERQEGGHAEDVAPTKVFLQPVGSGRKGRRHRRDADKRPHHEGENDQDGWPEHRWVSVKSEAPAGGDVPRRPRLRVGVLSGLGHGYHLRRFTSVITLF